jgi:hypothetical protein
VATFRPVKTPLSFATAAAVLVVLAACVSRDEKAAATPDVLHGVPVIAGSQLLDTTGTPEAARASFYVMQKPDTVAAIYRRYLVTNGWRLVSDVHDQGGTDLYAERQGPPLWIQIRLGENGNTRYTLIGAMGRSAPKPDSAAAP